MNDALDHWTTDEDLVASLPGGQAMIDWFGSCPSFHDARLEEIRFGRGEAAVVIKAFRMTSEFDARGYFVLDRHAYVIMKMYAVTGLKMHGDTNSLISDLTIRS